MAVANGRHKFFVGVEVAETRLAPARSPGTAPYTRAGPRRVNRDAGAVYISFWDSGGRRQEP